FDRKGVRWGSWFGGSCLGSLPLLPWLWCLWAHPSGQSLNNIRWGHLLEFKYWTRWITEPFGISIEYALERDFRDYLSWPHVRASHLPGRPGAWVDPGDHGRGPGSRRLAAVARSVQVGGAVDRQAFADGLYPE